MDLTLKVRITDHDQLWKAFDLTCKSKALYNFANYEVRKEFFTKHNFISHTQLCRDFKDRTDSNGDIPYKRLPSTIAQQVLKQLSTNWFSFSQAMKEYSKNPSKFLGKPKPPNFIKKRVVNLVSINDKRYFPIKMDEIHFTKNCLNPVRVPKMIRHKNIKMIRIVPHHNVFDMEFVYEAPEKDVIPNGKSMAIDLGLNNFVTTANDAGIVPFIVNGKIIKSINQNYNHRSSYLKSRLPKGQYASRQLERLGLKRQDQLRDQLHKISTFVIDTCIQEDIRTLIVGWNKNMKQGSNMGRINNQNFVQIPFYKFRQMLEYKCQLNGIKYIEVGEAYSSKCSYFDLEPVCKHNQYVGKRISRGQFQTKSGAIVNADVNAAYNIHYLATGKRVLNPIVNPAKFNVGSRMISTSCNSCISG